MNYINAKEAAIKWGISERRVRVLCTSGQIPEAIRLGKNWGIPEYLEKPLDGRTIEGKKITKNEEFKFPVFIFNQYYFDKENLKSDELELLEAQEYYLNANFSKSFITCKKLLNSKIPHVVLGALSTILYDSMLLGLIEEFKKYFKQLENLTKKATNYKSDYQLLLYDLANLSSLSIYKVKSLSPETIRTLSHSAYYHVFLMVITFDAIESIKGNKVPVFEKELIIKQFDSDNPIPIAANLHLLLAIIYKNMGKNDDMQYHLKKGVDYCIRFNWIGPLTRYSYFLSDDLYKEIESKDKKLVSVVKDLSNTELMINKLISMKNLGKDLYKGLSQDYINIIYLIICKVPDDEICKIVECTNDVLSEKIRKICKVLDVANKEQIPIYFTNYINNN